MDRFKVVYYKDVKLIIQLWKEIQKNNIYPGSDIQGNHQNHWAGGYFITQVSQVGNQLYNF